MDSHESLLVQARLAREDPDDQPVLEPQIATNEKRELKESD